MAIAVPDLSRRHGPLTELFDRPATPSDWRQYKLSDDQIEFFWDNGYVAGIRVLNDEQIAALRQELEVLVDPSAPGNDLFHEFQSNESTDRNKVLFHALGAWRVSSAFHDLLWNPAWLVPASQLLQGAVRFWHDQLFCKPARDGGVVAWHQDYSYWTRTRPMAHLTCWIGLDDATEANGCLQYIPGSHRWELLPITGLAGDMGAIQAVLNMEQRSAFAHPISVELKSGEAAFHHPLIVHGSGENRSDRPRRATVLNAFRDGTQSASDQPLLQGVDPIPPGQNIGGQFFPRLFDPRTAALERSSRGARGPATRRFAISAQSASE